MLSKQALNLIHYGTIVALLITAILLIVHINQMKKAEHFATVVGSFNLFNNAVDPSLIQYTPRTQELVDIITAGSPGINLIDAQSGNPKNPFIGPIGNYGLSNPTSTTSV